MSGARPRRGQPLLVLSALLLGWVGLRAALWEEIALPALPAPIEAAIAKAAPPVIAAKPVADQAVASTAPVHSKAFGLVQRAPLPAAPLPLAAPLPVQPAPLPSFASGGGAFDSTRVAAGHQLAWMAGVAQLPVPQFLQDRLGQTDRTASLMPAEARRPRPAPLPTQRWSADAWLLLREGGAGSAIGGLPSPSYGASQAGAVIRYRLSAASDHRPSAYLRASSAVRSPRGEEVALGLSARPLAQVPLTLLAEARVTKLGSGTRVRPAAGVVTELPRLNLPTCLSAEVYGQAGYVGGPDGTAFADGQLRIERRLARLGRGELRAGLGAWGGAQQGANRVDVGPTATLDFPLGGGQGRVSADWRLRAAGNAAPKSGPAITLSAGF